MALPMSENFVSFNFSPDLPLWRQQERRDYKLFWLPSIALLFFHVVRPTTLLLCHAKHQIVLCSEIYSSWAFAILAKTIVLYRETLFVHME